MSVNSKMTAIADAIRAKTGGTELLTLDAMAQDIAAIDTSKPEQTKTATPSLSQQTISPDSGKVLSGVTVEPITSTLLTSLDPDFKPENIAKDANLFGLVGTHAGGVAVETCTIKLYTYSTGMQPVGVCQIYTSDGIAVKEISEHYVKEYMISFGWVYILENVVCGSVLMLTDESGSVTYSPYIEGTAVVVSTSPLDDAWGIKTPSTKDEICVLDFN